MIRYVDSVDGIHLDMLHGFFEGWRRSVSPEDHLELLRRSDHVVLALDDSPNVQTPDTDPAPDAAATPDVVADRVVGFITAISDGVLAAYIPLLEVLPDYRGRGIGTELARRLLHRLNGLYMVDVMCDCNVQPFYERLGMLPSTGMVIRRT
jgi:ribosomal protein S18 acetylase RimI-like enzyme